MTNFSSVTCTFFLFCGFSLFSHVQLLSWFSKQLSKANAALQIFDKEHNRLNVNNIVDLKIVDNSKST